VTGIAQVRSYWIPCRKFGTLYQLATKSCAAFKFTASLLLDLTAQGNEKLKQ
jgi:hypothetical protein